MLGVIRLVSGAVSKDTDRIFRLNDEIAALRRDEDQAFQELTMLREIDDDARLDAIDGDPFDRADARQTASDVTRLETHVDELRSKRRQLERKRDLHLEQL
jgi:Spy/CpxP family protein refolding chaperone